MKPIKTHLLVILLFCSAGNVFAQDNLRDMVCIVRPQYSEDIKKFFSDYGRALSREGYMRAGTMFLARGSDGVFGSGVVIQHNNRFYVLSNQHVVSHAQFVTLEFRTIAGEIRRFENCLVVAQDRKYDLALIAFPQGADIQAGFVVSDHPIREGMAVWSAGFPGLGGSPSWQLGSGIISNQSIQDTIITNEKLRFVIQHTAQIDAGSSGGALLVASPDEQPTYSLIGINTWKARGREGANFAVPMSAVQSFLAGVTQESIEVKTTDRQQVEMLTKQLLDARNAENYKAILPFISEEFIFSVPVAVFTEMLNNASTAASADARTAFRNIEPFDAFKIVIADAIFGRLQRTTPTFGTVKTGKGDAGLSSTFTIRGREMEMEWALEDGEWLLVNTSLLRENNRAAQHNAWDRVRNTRYVSFGRLLDTSAPSSFSFVMETKTSKYFSGFYELIFGHQYINEHIYIRPVENFVTGEIIRLDTITTPARLFDYWGINIGLQFEYPMSFSSFPIQVIPFVKIPGGFGFNIIDNDDFIPFYINLNFSVRPGIRFAYPLGKKNRHIFIDLEYRYNRFIVFSDDEKRTNSNSVFGMSLGFAW